MSAKPQKIADSILKNREINKPINPIPPNMSSSMKAAQRIIIAEIIPEIKDMRISIDDILSAFSYLIHWKKTK